MGRTARHRDRTAGRGRSRARARRRTGAPTPNTAAGGFGFYWGSICFYVDSTDAITLPRRHWIIEALTGLAVDVVAVSAPATVARASSSVLPAAVCWRLAVVGVVDLVITGLSIRCDT